MIVRPDLGKAVKVKGRLGGGEGSHIKSWVRVRDPRDEAEVRKRPESCDC